MTKVDPAAARPLPRFAEFVAMMASLMALTALSIDVMLPALPQMRLEFALDDPNRQQLVVSSYVLGFAIGQLFHGPLSDWLGRKPVLLAGLAVYALAAFACMVAGDFETLLAARVVQGAANAAPRVIAIAVIRDIYGGRRMAEVMSFVMTVFIIVPVLAPSVGSLFLLAGSWHLIFGFLTAVAVAVLGWMALRLPETHPEDQREPISARWLLAALRETVTTRQTLGYTLAAGLLFGALMGYVNSAQQILTDAYPLGPWFPAAFGGVAAALALAAMLNGRLVMRVGMRRMSHAALLGFVAVGLAHVAAVRLLGQPPLALFLAMLGLELFCFGLMMPNFNALAMEPMGRIAGTASSFVGAVPTAVGAVAGWWIGRLYDGSVVPLLLGFVWSGALCLAAVLVTERGRLFRAGR